MSKRRRERPQDGGPSKIMMGRVRFLMAVCGILAFAVLGYRLYELQIRDYEFYESAAVEQQLRETTVSANRGTIYDMNGKILAMSASVDNVYISPREIEMYDEDAELIARGLSDILGVDYEAVLEMTYDNNSWYKTVARKVEPETAQLVREFKAEYGLNGVKLEADSKRYYPYGSLASHVIGFVGTDNYGLGGVEAQYENELAGISGSALRSTTAAGTEMLFTNFESYIDAIDGSDVTLTIDSSIQFYVEKHLTQAVSDYDVQNGAAAIVMDVDTGGILSMVSLGNFDLNNYQGLSYEVEQYIDELAQTDDEKAQLISEAQQLQWRNKALSDTYEPGSTFKIVTLAMGLNEGVIGAESSYTCNGTVDVVGRTEPVKCWRTQGHGTQDLTEAVQHSCNVAFVNIGRAVGAETFYEYAESFGFLERTEDKDMSLSAKTGIDMAGESGSIWWSENTFTNPNDQSQLAAASFGQTFTITPLQLITAISACVNGGNLMEPYLVQEIRAADGTIIESTEPELVRTVISEETSAEVRTILEAVVGDPEEGTGRNAYVPGYRIGGKTGTSEKVTHELVTGEKQYIVSFVGVAPADDPEIAVLVLLDNPSTETGIYISGGQMAAPVVGDIMADVLPYLGYEPQYLEEELANMDKRVPDVSGMSVVEASEAIEAAGLRYRLIGTGDSITEQLPMAGVLVASGSEMIIYAESHMSDDREILLDVSGLTYAEARDRLSYYGIYVSTDSVVTDAESQRVLSQNLEAGTYVEHGTIVEVRLETMSTDMLGIY